MARSISTCARIVSIVKISRGGDSHMKWTGMLVGNFEFNPIVGNPGWDGKGETGLQRGRDGKGETGSGKNVRGGEGRGRERGKGKPWEASLYRSFLDQLLF